MPLVQVSRKDRGPADDTRREWVGAVEAAGLRVPADAGRDGFAGRGACDAALLRHGVILPPPCVAMAAPSLGSRLSRGVTAACLTSLRSAASGSASTQTADGISALAKGSACASAGVGMLVLAALAAVALETEAELPTPPARRMPEHGAAPVDGAAPVAKGIPRIAGTIALTAAAQAVEEGILRTAFSGGSQTITPWLEIPSCVPEDKTTVDGGEDLLRMYSICRLDSSKSCRIPVIASVHAGSCVAGLATGVNIVAAVAALSIACAMDRG